MLVEITLIGVSLVCLTLIALVRKPITWRSIKSRIEHEWEQLASEGAISLTSDKDDFIRIFKREIVRILCVHSAAIAIPALFAVWVCSVAYLVILPMTVIDLAAWCMVAITGIVLCAFMIKPRYFLDEENYYFEHARARVLNRLEV
jgi:hypothetical protein